MEIGFIGAGGMAGTLIEKVDGVPDATISAVCDIDEGAAREAADPRGATTYTDHEALFATESLDALFVAIPPFAYDDQVCLAAERGIDVFVEKPVALQPDHGRQVITKIEDAGIVTGAGYVFRYDEITDAAKGLLEGREIASLDGRYWSGLLANDWGNDIELSGGEIVTRSTHVYDLLRYFAGEAVRVSAVETDRIGTEQIDYADATTATIEHASGVVSSVTSAVTSPEWTVELDIVADDAHLRLDYASQEITGTVDGDEVSREFSTDRYGREVEAFLEAARNDDPAGVRSDYRDALQSLSLCWTVIDAAESGKSEIVSKTRRS